MAEKYVTFHADEWDHYIERLKTLPPEIVEGTEGVLNLIPDPVPDAEVFRHQDLVAAPIFYNAASIYLSYLELGSPYLDAGQKEYLRVVADHFFEAADRSVGLPARKLPD